MEQFTDKRKETNWCVYRHTNEANNKRYIGITCNKPTRRWCNGWGYVDCPRFYNAIQKYGWDSFRHDILFTDLTQEEAERIEVELIAKYETTNPDKGYNICPGGGVNAGWTLSEEAKRRLSEANRGANNPHYGRPRPAETKAKISAAKKGVPRSEETKQKLRKPVVRLEDGAVFTSLADAKLRTGVSDAHISSCCHGYRKTAGGYHWRYADEAVTVDG